MMCGVFCGFDDDMVMCDVWFCVNDDFECQFWEIFQQWGFGVWYVCFFVVVVMDVICVGFEQWVVDMVGFCLVEWVVDVFQVMLCGFDGFD